MPIIKCRGEFWVALQFPLTKELAVPLNKGGWQHSRSHPDPTLHLQLFLLWDIGLCFRFQSFWELKKKTNQCTDPIHWDSDLIGLRNSPIISTFWKLCNWTSCMSRVDDCCFTLLLINLVTGYVLLFFWGGGEHNLYSLAAICVFVFLWSERMDWALKILGSLEDSVTARCSVLSENGFPVYTTHYISWQLHLHISLQHCSDYMIELLYT